MRRAYDQSQNMRIEEGKIKEYQVKDVNEIFNTVLIHGMNMLLHPFPKNQIQLQKPSLFAPI